MTNLTTKRQQQAGFTLIELLIVVAILGLLAAIGIPQYQGYQAQAKINATKAIHTSTTKFLGAELAKCTAGSTTMIGSTACTATTSAVATALATYINANSKNPYNTANPAVVAAALGTTPGTTYLVVTGQNIAITAAYTNLDGTAGTTPTITITQE